MANNRLWIQVKGDSKSKILFAKYYPDTGWYCYHEQETFDEWFDMFVNENRLLHGSTNLELVYEER